MKFRHIIIVAFAIIFSSLITHAEISSAKSYWLGADLSGITQLEALGQKFYDTNGVETDLFDLMRDYGINGARLRVWVDPKHGLCAPEDVLKMALRAQKAGMDVMIDFHYSDWWADPGKQNIPLRWKNLTYEQMKGALAEHTSATLQLLRNAGIDVKWVQVGNETSNGMLWPMANATENMAQYAGLTQAGYDAVKAIYPDAIVIVHLDNGFDEDLYNWIFDGLKENGAKWDMIGMSLYPFWSMKSKKVQSEEEALQRCINNIKNLKKKYNTDIMLVEVGVEANNPVEGKAFIEKVLEATLNDTDNACKGVWYYPEADGVLDSYKLGAFKNRRPTIIMDAFRDFSAANRKL